MRNLSFDARHPETGYWYLKNFRAVTYDALSEKVHSPVYEPARDLKEQVLDGAIYGKVEHHENT
jgi:hypothetical protein